MRYETLYEIIYLHRQLFYHFDHTVKIPFTLVCSEAVVYTRIHISSRSYSVSSCHFLLEELHIILIEVAHQLQSDLLCVCLTTFISDGYEIWIAKEAWGSKKASSHTRDWNWTPKASIIKTGECLTGYTIWLEQNFICTNLYAHIGLRTYTEVTCIYTLLTLSDRRVFMHRNNL